MYHCECGYTSWQYKTFRNHRCPSTHGVKVGEEPWVRRRWCERCTKWIEHRWEDHQTYHNQQDRKNKMLKLNSQGLNTRSFLRFENSTKYPNSIAVFCHEDGRPGGEYIILDAEQVSALIRNLGMWQRHPRAPITPKIEGTGL